MTFFSIVTQTMGFIGWLLLTFATAAVGVVASLSAPRFYAQLVRPEWSPPTYLFGRVWTVLYVMMAIAAWLVWRRPGPKRRAMTLFMAQLALNALWSWLFFAWHLGALATLEILVLFGLIAWTGREFARTSRVAAWLMAPYLLWVGFASLLTWALWRANPGLL